MSDRPESGNLTDPLMESAILGACMRETECLSEAVARGLTAADFHMPAHQLIWQAIAELHQQGKPADMNLVHSHLRAHGHSKDVGGPAAIFGHAAESTLGPELLPHYVRELRMLSVKRQFVNLGDEATTKGASNPDIASTIADLTAELADLQAAADVDAKDTGMASAVAEAMEWAEEVEQSGGELLGPSFTLPDLDRLTRGLRRTEVYTLAGRPAMGKSLAAGVITLAAARAGMRTVFVSLEMSRLDLTVRLICAEAGMPKDPIEQGTMSSNDWKRFSQATGVLSDLPLHIVDDVQTFGDVVSAVERTKRKLGGMDLIVLDYLQLVELGEKTGNRQEEVSTVSRRMKLMAKQHGCSVLQLSQLSRKVEERPDKRPMLSDLRESGAIEQDSAGVLFLYRDEVYNPDNVDTKGIIEFILAKNRHGPTGVVSASFLPHMSTFRPLARPGQVGGPPDGAI